MAVLLNVYKCLQMDKNMGIKAYNFFRFWVGFNINALLRIAIAICILPNRCNSLEEQIVHQSKGFCTSQSLCTQTMKAVRITSFGGPEVLKVDSNVPIPKPSGSQVLIKVFAAGVNPVDTYIRSGTHTIKPSLPYVPGKDGAGIVEESNEGKFKKGDRVYFINCAVGSYAEYTVAESKDVFPLNSRLSFSQGAAIGVPYFTAYRALVLKNRVRAGESLLVHGASGAVGIAACQIGRSLGLTVYGTAGTSEGMELVRQNGAHLVFNHREKGYQDKIMAATEGQGVDNVLEMLANVNLDYDLQMMKKLGRIAIIGSRGPVEINPRYAMTMEVSIHGVMLFSGTSEDMSEIGAFLKAAQEQDWMKPQVGTELSLTEASTAHQEVMSHTGGSSGKIVLKIH